jgi:hypothetical protein
MATSKMMRVRPATVIRASIPGNQLTVAPFFAIHAKGENHARSIEETADGNRRRSIRKARRDIEISAGRGLQANGRLDVRKRTARSRQHPAKETTGKENCLAFEIVPGVHASRHEALQGFGPDDDLGSEQVKALHAGFDPPAIVSPNLDGASTTRRAHTSLRE